MQLPWLPLSPRSAYVSCSILLPNTCTSRRGRERAPRSRDEPEWHAPAHRCPGGSGSISRMLALRHHQTAYHRARQNGHRGLALQAAGAASQVPLAALPDGVAKHFVTHGGDPTPDRGHELRSFSSLGCEPATPSATGATTAR